MKQLAIYAMTYNSNGIFYPRLACDFFENIFKSNAGLLRLAFCKARNDGGSLLRIIAHLFRDLKNLSIVLIFFITPLHAQNFDMLLDELSGSETEQVESEMTLPPKEKEKPPLPPSSNEIQAAELQASPTENSFAPLANIVTNGVTLQGLDKQTARVFIIDARVGQPIEFGTLKIIVQRCEKAPLENRQESVAFIRITEQKPNSTVQNLFSGWMFSSCPALSALDHPNYDVWIKECKVLD